MTLVHGKHRKLAAMISNDLRKVSREAGMLQRCEHDYDFKVVANSIIADLTTLAAKYQAQLQELYANPPMSEAEVSAAVHALLDQLPAGYPPASFTVTPEGYQLVIDHTVVFREASDEDAIMGTKNYVEARKRNPDLPVGVVNGIYD
jgi:hypothetical protein